MLNHIQHALTIAYCCFLLTLLLERNHNLTACIFAMMTLPRASLSACVDEDVVVGQLLAIGGGHLTINKGGRPLPCLHPLFLWQGRQRGDNNEDNNDN
jgi:hypothetical protein